MIIYLDNNSNHFYSFNENISIYKCIMIFFSILNTKLGNSINNILHL